MSRRLRHVVLVANPASGGGAAAALVDAVREQLRTAGVTVELLVEPVPDLLLERTSHAVAAGVDAVVALGGDGTVHAAIQAVAQTDVPLGIVAAGTGNDTARSLGLPHIREAIGEALDVILAGRVGRVDAGRLRTGDGRSRWFLSVVSSGFDAQVNERANRMRRPRGHARYLVAIGAELRTFRPHVYRVGLDDTAWWEAPAMLVAVGNGASYGGGMRICPRARLDDGLLDVTLLGPLSRVGLLRAFQTVYHGTHLRHPAVHTARAACVTLDATRPVVAYADGEPAGLLPARIEAVRGAVGVLLPGEEALADPPRTGSSS